MVTTHSPEALSDQTPAEEPAPDAVPAPPGNPVDEGTLVALEINGTWVLGREGESEVEHRKRAVFEDGSVRTYRNRPGTVRSVTPGSMFHRLVQAPEKMQERMRTSPADVVVEVLEANRAPLSKRDIEAKLADLRLLPDGPWWPAVSRELKAHPRVVVEGAKYGLRRTE